VVISAMRASAQLHCSSPLVRRISDFWTPSHFGNELIEEHRCISRSKYHSSSVLSPDAQSANGASMSSRRLPSRANRAPNKFLVREGDNSRKEPTNGLTTLRVQELRRPRTGRRGDRRGPDWLF
jgi:hypothetical protein